MLRFTFLLQCYYADYSLRLDIQRPEQGFGIDISQGKVMDLPPATIIIPFNGPFSDQLHMLLAIHKTIKCNMALVII